MMLVPKDLLAKVKEKFDAVADKPISEEGQHVEKVGRALLVVAVVAAAVFLLFFHKPSHSKALTAAMGEGFQITAYDEPCQVKNAPSNLPYRIVWRDKGGAHEGCFAVRPDVGALVAYFDNDRTIAVIPLQHMRPLETL